MFGFFKFLAVALIAAASIMPAEARGPRGDWTLLGEQTVGFRVDRDIITVPDQGQKFSQLRIDVERNDVHLMSLALVYQNGYREELRVDRLVKPNDEPVGLDLKGARGYLKQIELVYRARPSFEGRAVVKVYGELEARWRPEPQTARGFDVIGTEDVSRGERRVTFDVGRREGRFAAIRFRAEDGDIRLRGLKIVFGNGQTQDVDVEDRLDEGQMSRVIDLEGDRRFIRQVIVEARPGRGERRGKLTLLGREDERRPEPPRERGFDVIGTEDVSRGDRTVEFDVGRRQGRFAAIRFRADGGDIRIRGVRITFANGERQDVDVGDRLREGEMTKVIDLEGDRRAIHDVRVEARPGFRDRGAKLTLLGREDDRGGGHRPAPPVHDEWVTLGRAGAAMFKADTDTFRVGRDAGTFRAIRVVVNGSPVRFYGLSIKYGNGEVETVPLSGSVGPGQASQAFDLKGRERFIETITFRYRSGLTLSGPAAVEIQGLKHGPYRGR
ncbi:MAG: hypothetical protein AB7E80_06610 [Hyphomicrobiaceae bacterium]